ncbi:PAS domain-containing hybrid sensor histidine kinase/response regulator [Baaleninema sp.]|uniref:PAS domain-containing hybrid sensor histidine kinase/response regulator n=1 Tax=Baaleninema sp. TaxID=3101197 RepID=UPI003CFDD335
MSLQSENDELRRKVAELERQLQQFTCPFGDRNSHRPETSSSSPNTLLDTDSLTCNPLHSLDEMVYTTDLDRRLTFLNPYGQHLLRCSAISWKGRSLLDFIVPSDREKMHHAFESLNAHGRLNGLEVRLQPLTGEIVEVEINACLQYRNGKPVGVFAVVRDVSERKQFERQLQLFHQAIDAAGESAAILERNGTIVYANAATARAFGYDVNALCGQSANLFLSPDADTHIDDLIQNALRCHPYGWSGEILCQHDNDTRFPSLISITAVPDEGGQVSHLFVLFHDISRQKASQVALADKNHELERASQLKSAFLANMSHELRTPLTSILGFANLLLQEIYGTLNDKQQLYLERIHESGEHLLRLIGDILDLSKVEAGKLELDLSEVSIPQLCADTIALVSEPARSRQITLHTDLDPQINTLEGDELRLRQMLVNLLSNAVKFSHPGGDVGIEVRQESDRLQLTVWDEGIGIPQEQQSLLFQPFQQLDSSLSRQHEGTGLGLALTRKLAELHGGTVTCQSQLGKGSRFTIELSLQRPRTRSHSQTSPCVLNPSVRANAVRLLLVEDHDANALLLQDILEFWGFHVDRVSRGGDALSYLERHRPDCILMDVHLPDANGLEITRHIKNHPRWQNIPVIATTALAMVGDRDRCLNAGCDDYLSKPIGCDRLAGVLSQHLSLSPTSANKSPVSPHFPYQRSE